MELKQILQKAHSSCERKDGALSQITYEQLKKINDIYIKRCDYCPFDKCESKICSGTEEKIYYKLCPECNKCNKWTVPDEEEIINILYENENFEDLIRGNNSSY